MARTKGKRAACKRLLKQLPHRSKKALTTTLDSRKCMDPLEYLPLEICQLIFSFLSYKTTLSAFCVSKSWENTLSSFNMFKSTLHLKRFWFGEWRNKERRAFVGGAIRCLGTQKRIRRLVVDQTDPSTAKVLCDRLQRNVDWSNIECVHIERFGPSLATLEWNLWRSLKSLELGCNKETTPQMVLNILRTCVELRECVIKDILFSPRNSQDFFSKLPYNDELEVLTLRFRYFLMEPVLMQFPVLWPYPNLRSLTFVYGSFIGVLDLSMCHSLTELHLLCRDIDRITRFEGPPNVEMLSIGTSMARTIDRLGMNENWNMPLQNITSLALNEVVGSSAMLEILQTGGLSTSRLLHLYICSLLGPATFPQDLNDFSFTALEILVIQGCASNRLALNAFSRVFPNVHTFGISMDIVRYWDIVKLIERPDNKITILRLNRDNPAIPEIMPEILAVVQSHGVEVSHSSRPFLGFTGDYCLCCEPWLTFKCSSCSSTCSCHRD